MKPISILLLLLILAPCYISCVSKKKFLSEVSSRQVCDSTLQKLNSRNLELNRQIANLELQLAEKTGERNAFREIIDKKETQIDKLEQEIERVTNKSLNKQESLDITIKQKNDQLAEKQATIDGFKSGLSNHEKQLNDIMNKLRENLSPKVLEGIELEVKNGIGRIIIAEDKLFRSGTTLKNEAYSMLEIMAGILLEYPAMDIQVVGHTDNEPVKTRSLNDNWDLSVLRATPLVRSFVKDFGLNPNQIMACGKGDSKPKAANDTAAGREQNRRTEILILPPTDRVIQKFVNSNQ